MKNIKNTIQLIIYTIIVTSCLAQDIRIPKVQESTLTNGLKVLLIEKPNTNIVNTQVFIKGGRSQVGNLPPLAADLLMRTVFKRIVPINIEKQLSAALEQETKAHEALVAHQAYEIDQIVALNSKKAEALTTIVKNLENSECYDELDSLGATARKLTVTADYCSYSMNIPAKSITNWCQLIANNIKNLPCARFPLERNQLTKEILDGLYQDPESLATLVNIYSIDLPYSTVNTFTPKQINLVSLNSLVTYAKRILAPENIVVIIVGDIAANIIMPQLEGTLGKLPKTDSNSAPLTQVTRNEFNVETQQKLTNSRLIVNSVKKNNNQILLCWPLPAIDKQNSLLTQTLVKILQIGYRNNLIATQHICHDLTINVGIPGQMATNLMIIKAEPELWCPINELERAIQNETANIRQRFMSELELQKIQAELEAGELLIQEDVELLANAIGKAQCQGNSWKLAFCALEASNNITGSQVQKVAYDYLMPSKMTTIIINTDDIQISSDWIEQRLAQIITPLLEYKLSDDPIKMQTILKETTRQLRMLPNQERKKILELLESNVKQ